MKIIKTYENYNLDDLDLGRFKNIIDKSLLKLNSDGTFDYDGDLDFFKMELKSFSEIPIRFRNVSGFFHCYGNYLISLKGSPERLTGGDFHCGHSDIISLQYAPLVIYGNLACNNGKLLSKVCLSDVKGSIQTYNNPFEITERVIDTVKRMTYEQQMAELDFFEKYDSNAYKMLSKILIDLRVEFGSDYRKEIIRTLKGSNDNYNMLGL